MNLLITGGAGFIGSHFVKYTLAKYPEYKVVNLDLLTYAGNLSNLTRVSHSPNYTFVRGNITNKELVSNLVRENNINAIINFAAESHVDRSISDPSIFVISNVLGTQTLLDVAKECKIDKYVQISTDEVYGSLGEHGLFSEETPLAPNSPYAASKAAADLLVRSYYETYKMNACITRCSNNYGPYQFPEKLIPLMILNALNDKELPIYGDGKNIRDWLHVEDHCSAIDLVLHEGLSGEVYNIGGHNEKMNIEMVELILENLNKPKSLINFVQDRLGHDRRYAIDPTKIQRELGWKPNYMFETGIKDTIDWYVTNKDWSTNINNGTYLNYYQKYYGR